ncbi:tryptophan halogenase family protein [Thalassomonas actiniarum]|uniref:Tryptophan 7-halogenase n=1 Tax=Thalassomonas actiniarum TaxID=485447 RepID=A0AAE9YNY7_9GAMM|nr:tryptophan halogenase family protein [Thalassomonas actiniarum]WDD97548.1 tryptophan 7-halogenase [Thalassomonas actiniarum]
MQTTSQEDNKNKKIQRVVIAGGGSAGWMTAASLSKLLGKSLDITLIESEEIGRIGVGEATIPPLRTFNELLGINEQHFMKTVRGTFKLGIEFKNWGRQNDSYIHSFGDTGRICWAGEFQHFYLAGLKKGIKDEFGAYCPEHAAAKAGKFLGSRDGNLDYAYHLDAGLYADYLKQLALGKGVKRLEGKIEDVSIQAETGYIQALTLDNGTRVEGDLFIDCTGFAARLIEGALNTGFESYSHLIPCDSAVAVQTEKAGEPRPYTQAIAHNWGWQWRIPLQHRVGNGLVFCSRYTSDEEAIATLMDNLESPAITEPKVFRYNTGRRVKGWNKNCIAIGLASGFVEPVESTAIHLIMASILRLMKLFPHNEISQANIDEYNNQTREEMERIRDFIILHYKATERDDSPFWRYCQNMEVPQTLAHRMELFKKTARVCITQSELFRLDSWTQVMMGQGIMPENYHQIVDQMSDAELAKFLKGIKGQVDARVADMPGHQEFINYYCKAL